MKIFLLFMAVANILPGLVRSGQASSATFTVTLPEAGTGAALPLEQESAQCIVDWNDLHQRIDGFGASSAWRTSLTTPQADLLFSTNTGIVYTDNAGHRSTNNGAGLSLLRTRIAPGGTTIEGSIMQQAQARGARVWSTPWTPPAMFKDSGALDGGDYLGSGANATNLAYASQLADYVVSMKNTYGVSLCAISVQNEPDVNHTDPGGYETCLWTSQQIHDFTTNLIIVRVADNGSPSLSDTNSFTITVNPLEPPTLGAISVSGGQVSLVADGSAGPDYTFWASTNLQDWQTLWTAASPAPPVILVDTNPLAPARFYRVQLGPP